MCECALWNLLYPLSLQTLACMLTLMAPSQLFCTILLQSVSPVLINNSLAYFESVGMCVIYVFQNQTKEIPGWYKIEVMSLETVFSFFPPKKAGVWFSPCPL